MSRSSADKRDVYYRLCKSEGYRARSAYKLLHLDEEFDLFRGVKVACDFCAAPGSWSQVLSRKLRPAGKQDPAKIVSIDLQPMAPLPGVTIIHADITLPTTHDLMMNAMGGEKADLAVCDGAPEVTGVHDLDAYLHAQLLLAATTLALPLLAPHATLIFKVFLSPSDPAGEVLISQLEPFFTSTQRGDPTIDDTKKNPYLEGGCEMKGYDQYGRRGGVWVRKPRSSRAGSAEHFLVCRNFNPASLPANFDSKVLTQIQSLSLEPPKEALDASVVEASRSDQKEKTNVTVLYFASIRTHLKVEQETYQTLPTLVGLKDEIIARHPDPTTRSILEGSMWSVGDEMVDLEDDVELKERDVVAVIPPVSGG